MLPVSLDLVRDGVLSMSDMIAKMTSNPARLLQLDSGTLNTGSEADVTIFDPEATWTVDRETLVSKGKNTPWHGKQMTGQVTHTIKAGRIVFENGTIHG
jgi:dihydroorotase